MTKTILAVDDSRTIRTAVSYTFQTSGYDVLAVDSGPDAVAQVGRGSVSIVLLDVGLPEQDGYEVAKSLRSQAPAVPILLLTSAFHPWDEARGEQAGVDGHIDKPFATQALIDLVERTVAAAEERPRLAAVPDVPDDAWSFSDDVEEIAEIDIEDIPEADIQEELSVEGDFQGAPSDGRRGGSSEVSLDLSSFDDPDPEPAPLRAASPPPQPPPSPTFDPEPSPLPRSGSHSAGPSTPRPGSHSAGPPPSRSGSGTRPDLGAPYADAPLQAATDEVVQRATSSPGLGGVDEEAVRAMAREVVERIAWEVVPELAEVIIREEIARLTRD